MTGSSARRIFVRRNDNDDDCVFVLVHGTKLEELG